MPISSPRALTLLAAATMATAACGKGGGRATCGFTSVAGANLLLGAFATPNLTLSAAPKYVPAELPVRIVAGPLYRGSVSRTDSLLQITLPADSGKKFIPGSAVLVQDTTGHTRGVVLFDAPPVAGAPLIGSVQMGGRTVPLVGINVDPAPFEDAKCPLFSDGAGS